MFWSSSVRNKGRGIKDSLNHEHGPQGHHGLSPRGHDGLRMEGTLGEKETEKWEGARLGKRYRLDTELVFSFWPGPLGGRGQPTSRGLALTG